MLTMIFNEAIKIFIFSSFLFIFIFTLYAVNINAYINISPNTNEKEAKQTKKYIAVRGAIIFTCLGIAVFTNYIYFLHLLLVF